MSHLAVKSDGSLKIDEECIGDLLPREQNRTLEAVRENIAAVTRLILECMRF